MGLRHVLIVGLVFSVHRMIPRNKLFGLNEASPYSTNIRSFQSQQHFHKAMFCLGEKQGMLVNDVCNRVRKLFVGLG